MLTPDEPVLVDIGGRRLALQRAGSGSPPVILVGGAGLGMRLWRRVVPIVASLTEVVAYDRAGLGLSDPPPGVRGFDGPANDLHELLCAAAIPPPYVLVAHSVGAYIAEFFTDQHR